MLSNLGLYYMDDYNFDMNRATKIVKRFLDREYEPNGKGGLFQAGPLYKDNIPFDFRSMEIWGQAMWYLSTYAVK